MGAYRIPQQTRPESLGLSGRAAVDGLRCVPRCAQGGQRLKPAQERLASQAKILIRGFARVGIIHHQSAVPPSVLWRKILSTSRRRKRSPVLFVPQKDLGAWVFAQETKSAICIA